jgi:hypothetical protein
MTVSIVFLFTSFTALFPGTPRRAPIERDAPLRERSFSCLSKSPIKRVPLQVPQRDPYGERCPFAEPSLTSRWVPDKWSFLIK